MKAVFNGTLGKDYLFIMGFSSDLVWRTLAGYQPVFQKSAYFPVKKRQQTKLLKRACSGFCFELQMAKIHSNFVTKMLM
jgi:hypothetical protein